MKLRHRSAIWLSSAALAALTTVSVAHAGAFALREQSAYGQGSSFAGIAAGGSLSSMFWNPATLSHVEGIEIEQVISGVIPFSDVEYEFPAAPGVTFDAGDIGQDAVIPAGYSAYRLNDRMVFGMGINGPFGLATKYDMDEPIRAAGVAGTAKVFSLNVNPNIAYQITDWVAVAVGAQIQYIDVRYTAVNLGPLGNSSLEGDDIGFGLTAGVHVKPWAGTEIGLGYRSFINHELDGELRTANAGEFDAKAHDFDLPDLVTFGVRQRITDRFRVMAGAEWSNWSRFDIVPVTGVPGTELPLEFEYDDGWFFSIGGEYDVTERVSVRAGVGYELSPLDEDNRTFRLPDNDRLWLSAGASYEASDRFAFDLGYSFLSAADTDILAGEDFGGDGPGSNGPFSGDADAHVHIISAGLKVKFGHAPAGVMDQPVVVKY